MNQRSRSANKSAQSDGALKMWAVAAILLIVGAWFPAQGQQSGSLADAAREARAQKQAQPKVDNNHAQQVADQLAEDHDDKGAPEGFQTYLANDYKLTVPAPYVTAGHEDAGIVLLGPQVGSTHAMVMAGTPILLSFEGNDSAFHDAAAQFTRHYAQTSDCTKGTVAGHNAYRCSLAAGILDGKKVNGAAIFVRGPRSVAPVFCVAVTSSAARDTFNNPLSDPRLKKRARDTMDLEERDVQAVWGKCEVVLQSIRFREDSAQPGMRSAAEAKDSEKTPASQAATPAPAGGSSSLADIARRLHETPGQPVAAVSSESATTPAPQVTTTVPEGFKVHAFQYCSAPRMCWNASVLVPVDAKLISSACNQYAFEVKVQGSPFVLMAGSGGAECGGNGPDPVRWHQLVDPENKRAPGTYSTISSQVAKIDDKPATITTLAFRKGLTDWMGKRADIENNGAEVVVGCMAPRDNFADGDTVCSALIGSIRLP